MSRRFACILARWWRPVGGPGARQDVFDRQFLRHLARLGERGSQRLLDGLQYHSEPPECEQPVERQLGKGGLQLPVVGPLAGVSLLVRQIRNDGIVV